MTTRHAAPFALPARLFGSGMRAASMSRGATFTFSCTTDGLGEYVFGDDASDGSTNDWPAASSASVLSTAGGGPNVAVWNLGSTTDPVPGQVVTGGYTAGIYALRGANTKTRLER